MGSDSPSWTQIGLQPLKEKVLTVYPFISIILELHNRTDNPILRHLIKNWDEVYGIFFVGEGYRVRGVYPPRFFMSLYCWYIDIFVYIAYI